MSPSSSLGRLDEDGQRFDGGNSELRSYVQSSMTGLNINRNQRARSQLKSYASTQQYAPVQASNPSTRVALVSPSAPSSVSIIFSKSNSHSYLLSIPFQLMQIMVIHLHISMLCQSTTLEILLEKKALHSELAVKKCRRPISKEISHT